MKKFVLGVDGMVAALFLMFDVSTFIKVHTSFRRTYNKTYSEFIWIATFWSSFPTNALFKSLIISKAFLINRI